MTGVAGFLVVFTITFDVERMSARAMDSRARGAERAALSVPQVVYADAFVRPAHRGLSIEMRIDVDASNELDASRAADSVRIAVHQEVASRLMSTVSFGWPLELTGA